MRITPFLENQAPGRGKEAKKQRRRIRKTMERIDELSDPEYKTELLTENAIKFHLR
jgi:hypothetical protein